VHKGSQASPLTMQRFYLIMPIQVGWNFRKGHAGYTPNELSTEAAVSLEPEGQGFRISRSALTLRASVPNLDEAKFRELAGTAEKTCPVSKVLNAQITLDAKLE
jgi:organic hydroperoxide reductase OsmC/OhrA